jgi:hypothetical protein
MLRSSAILLLLILFLVACNNQKKDLEIRTTFSIPFVYQEKTSDSIYFHNEDFLSHAFTSFFGKSKFCDTLKIPIKPEIDTTFYRDFLFESFRNELDSLGLDGFEIFPDYKTSVSKIVFDNDYGNYFYPVYIVNQTPNTKLFIGKDSHVFAIQEAIDEKGDWRPIEGRAFDFCGNGYWGLKVNTNEFITVLIQKYAGDYKTKLRVRIQNRDIIYVSKPFDGIINKKQFILNKEEAYHHRQLLENKPSAIQHMFYGAEPKELGDENFGLHAVLAQ